MKKTLFALAALALTGAAQAQSSVTLYGDVDGGVRYQTHANSATGATANIAPAGVQTNLGTKTGNLLYMPVGGMTLNYWGLRGSEDLGGGMKAIFQLENRFNLSNGQNNTAATSDGSMFREAYVGVQGNFGRLTLGRQNTVATETMATTYGPFDGSINLYKPEIQQFGTGYGGAFATSTTSVWDGLIASNAVKYYASVAGVTFGAMYALGEQPQNANGMTYNRGATISTGIRYATGPFAIGAAYQQVTSVATGAAFAGASANNVDNVKFKNISAGASYTTDFIRVNAGWVGRSASGTPGTSLGAAAVGTAATSSLSTSNFSSAGTSQINSSLFFGGVNVNVTPAASIGGQLWYTRSDDTYENRKLLGAVVAKYKFSKRTFAYLESDYTLRAPSDTATTKYVKPFGVMLGINHKF